jgi:Na+/H+ antiporter NhaD/arsenite permease-like protein
MVALAGAAVLLTSRTMASRKTLCLVDWQLLVLFIGLFIINRSFSDAGGMEAIGAMLSRLGISLRSSGWLFGVCAVLSNLGSNVPAVMLLLSLAPDPSSGPLLAIVSTFAGNLLVVGSIANIIVLDQAAASGVKISWERHARTGIPVTLASLAVAAVWLAAFSW